MTNTIPVITIDGPSGVGKGTTTLRVARYLNWHTLDSGAMYRTLALAALQTGVALNDEMALATLAEALNVTFQPLADLSGTAVILNNTDVSLQLRTEDTANAASQVAVFEKVRQALLARQRAFQQAPGLVADGRDMGTVVFPDAAVKIFLTANCEERALRRYKQLKEKGINAKLDDLIQEIKVRDERDSNRVVAPLVAAEDARIIDTSSLSIEAVVALVLKEVPPASLTA